MVRDMLTTSVPTLKNFFTMIFYAKILAKHHIHSILNTIPDGIEVTSRTDDEYEYIFIQNFSYRNIDIVLPKKGDIIYGNKNGNIRQYETIVFRKKLFLKTPARYF